MDSQLITFENKTKEEQKNEIKELIEILQDWDLESELDEKYLIVTENVKLEFQRQETLSVLKKLLRELMGEEEKKSGLYLNELFKKYPDLYEKKSKGSNILIVAPTGSGKTTFMHSLLEGTEAKALLLVSTTSLKDSIAPNDNELKEKLSNRSYTMKNKKKYGEEKYSILVKSYAQFGREVRDSDEVYEEFDYIFCDEFHSLPSYQRINNSADLAVALKVLLSPIAGKKIFYFTATEESLLYYKNNFPKSFEKVEKIDVLKHSEVRRYVSLFDYSFTSMEEMRKQIRIRAKRFKYFGFKVMAYSKRIDTQLDLARIAEEEGYNPICIWSTNNDERKMNEEQMKVREHLLTTGELMAPYDFLVINSSMQEGWNLTDKRVNLMIMNTTNETEYVQATGRMRGDIQVVLRKTKQDPSLERNLEIFIPKKYIGVNLSTPDTEELAKFVDVKSPRGETLKWRGLKKELEKTSSSYNVKPVYVTVNGKRSRNYVITLKKEGQNNG